MTEQQNKFDVTFVVITTTVLSFKYTLIGCDDSLLVPASEVILYTGIILAVNPINMLIKRFCV